MNNNIIEILELILTGLKDENVELSDLSKIFGGEPKEESVDPLETNADELEKVEPQSKDSFRYFLESEQMFFTKEVRGELIQLQSMGLITGKEVEQLIETAIFKDFKLIDREELKNLLPSIIVANSKSSGSNFVLGNDSIN
jgi:predicted Ser/Thr protein kinase